MTIIQTESIEKLDFDFAPPCEQTINSHKEPFECSNTAEWKAVSVNCLTVTLICDPCRLMILGWNNSYGSRCTICGYKALSGRSPWLSIERI